MIQLFLPEHGIRIDSACRWDPDNGGKPTYKSYDVDINRYDLLWRSQTSRGFLTFDVPPNSAKKVSQVYSGAAVGP